MGVHFFAAVAQVTRAIATSEPCTFDASHASITDCSHMDKGRKVCCGIYEDQKEILRNKAKKTTFGVDIWRRAGWKMIARAILEQVR
jgi:hypothetical protein